MSSVEILSPEARAFVEHQFQKGGPAGVVEFREIMSDFSLLNDSKKFEILFYLFMRMGDTLSILMEASGAKVEKFFDDYSREDH